MVIMPKLFCARKELNYLCGNEEKKKKINRRIVRMKGQTKISEERN